MCRTAIHFLQDMKCRKGKKEKMKSYDDRLLLKYEFNIHPKQSTSYWLNYQFSILMFMIEPYYFEYDFVLQMSLYFLDRKVSRGITFILAIIWQAKNDSSASSTLGIPTNFLPDKSGFCTEWFCSRSADWAPFPCCASMTSTGSIQPWKTEYIFGCLASL